MRFDGGNIYHIYNRSLRGGKVFYSDKNYAFFLNKITTLKSYCEILAYCLMPDHFHLMIYVPENSPGYTCQTALSGLTGMQLLSRKIGTILSSYAQAINKQESTTGSIFQPKTKAKDLTDGDHAFICFQYIHQNPLKANMVSKMEDYMYTSFNEYSNKSSRLCNINLGYELLNLPNNKENFYQQSYAVIGNNLFDKSSFQ